MDVSEFLHKHLDDLVLRALHFAPKLIGSILLLFIGLWFIKRISRITEKAMLKKDLEVSLRTFLKSLISIGLRIILIVTVAGMIGIGTTSFVTILGAAGLAIGLALQGSLANFAGGVLILIFKPFKVGDVIDSQGIIGKVTEIQIFNTILTTFDQRMVILPNGNLSNNVITNVTRSGILRADIPITLSMENNLDHIRKIINEVLSNSTVILKDPAPVVVFTKIADGSITVNIRPYCENQSLNLVLSEVNIALKKAFDENGIKQFIPKF